MSKKTNPIQSSIWIAEQGILLIIALATIGATILELIRIFDVMTVNLSDLFLLFDKNKLEYVNYKSKPISKTIPLDQVTEKNRFLKGFICMIIYVSCWPILAFVAGKLIPAIGSGDISRVSKIITSTLVIFLIQKIAQFGQDVYIAKPSLEISEVMRQKLFSNIHKIKMNFINLFLKN